MRASPVPPSPAAPLPRRPPFRVDGDGHSAHSVPAPDAHGLPADVIDIKGEIPSPSSLRLRLPTRSHARACAPETSARRRTSIPSHAPDAALCSTGANPADAIYTARRVGERSTVPRAVTSGSLLRQSLDVVTLDPLAV